MKLVPKRDQVVIRIDAKVEESAGGIVLPSASQDKPNMATVVAVGPGRHEYGVLVPIDLSAGDRVILKAWQPFEVDVDGEKLHLIEFGDILAAIEDE